MVDESDSMIVAGLLIAVVAAVTSARIMLITSSPVSRAILNTQIFVNVETIVRTSCVRTVLERLTSVQISNINFILPVS